MLRAAIYVYNVGSINQALNGNLFKIDIPAERCEALNHGIQYQGKNSKTFYPWTSVHHIVTYEESDQNND